MCGTGKRGGIIAAVLAMTGGLAAFSASAQVGERQRMEAEAEQRCVWSCLANFGPASNPAYHDCVARICLAPDTQPAARNSEPQQPRNRTAGWTNQSMAGGGGHSAAVEAGGKSFNYICQRRGKGLIGIAGMGGSADGVGLRVDGQRFGPPFVVQNGILYTAADPGSALLRALMAGNTVEITSSRGHKAGFPLRGSSAAIRKAMAACGIRP